jgi:hypothetical protein
MAKSVKKPVRKKMGWPPKKDYAKSTGMNKKGK